MPAFRVCCFTATPKQAAGFLHVYFIYKEALAAEMPAAIVHSIMKMFPSTFAPMRKCGAVAVYDPAYCASYS